MAREDLDALIEAAVHAGTASNGQSEGFIVIEDRNRLDELEQQVCKILWNGGLRYLGNPVGTAIVSTCWVGFLTAAAHMSRTIGQSLDIRKHRNIYGALMVGHAKHQYKRAIPRKRREVRWM